MKEIKIKQKSLLGYGDEQKVYPYKKDPNYVIKKQLHSSESSLDEYIDIQKRYPEFVAKVIKPKGEYKGYYFQEKLDNKSFMDDIAKIVIKLHNTLLKSLPKKYNTPEEAFEDLDPDEADISLGQSLWKLHRYDTWDSFEMKDFYIDDSDLLNVYDKYEDLLGLFNGGSFDSHRTSLFYDLGKSTPLIQKLAPLYKVPKMFGNFHEGNVGYDKNKNPKILDL